MSQTITPFANSRPSSANRVIPIVTNKVDAEEMYDMDGGGSGKQNSDDNNNNRNQNQSKGVVPVKQAEEDHRTKTLLSRISKSLTRSKSKHLGKEGSAELRTGKRRKTRPFLTSSQLTDLFNRLDRNGDGSLDLDEFTDIIQMLQLQVDEEYISKIFLKFKKDSLTMQEFICAYQKVYSNQIMDDMSSGKHEAEFIRATRYGVDEDGDRLFEMYLIEQHPAKSSKSATPARKIKFQLVHDDKEGIISLDDLFQSAKEEIWHGDLEDINTMIHRDNKANSDEGCRILWWVDIAMTNVAQSSIHKYVDTLGIPNNSKFLSNFSNFGTQLGKDPKARIFLGSGITVDGLISSMNVFVQTVALKDRPIVHHFPAWIENKAKTIKSQIFQYVKEYYVSRFAFVFNLSSFSNTNEYEKFISYESAEQVAKRLRDDVFRVDSDAEIEDDEPSTATQARIIAENSKSDMTPPIARTIMSSRGEGVPLSKQGEHKTPPTWIRSNAQLIKNRPSLKLDTLSMHVMDHGAGPNALITIRAIDDEKHSSKLSLEERSRCGVLGRMLDSIWTKLLLINSADGAADIAGELDESPMTLMSFISMMVHCFSMQSMSSLDYWMNMVELEIKDMAVSKHSSHLAEMSRITKDIKDYVDPLCATLAGFLSEWEKETESFMKAAAAVTDTDDNDDVEDFNFHVKEKVDRKTQVRRSIFPVPGAANQEKDKPSAVSSDTHMKNGRRRGSVRRSSRLVMMAALHETPSVFANATTLMELEKLPLSYSVVKVFMGDACYRDLRIILEGYELLEMKGLVDWQQRIEKYETRLNEMRTLIATQLEEKRNFTTFLLTIVTTILAPLTILTGYFGMNFENMDELNPATYPFVPGVKLMWAITGFLYIMMLFFAMHFRVIYSAT